jgi:HD-GYP domain-containing protein (c-di-GMP phosphodiesterase class II)
VFDGTDRAGAGHGAFTPSFDLVARRYRPVVSDSGVRLNELLMALSLATDLGFGQPAEHMVRSARLGMRLGARLGLDDADLAVLYDVSILTYVGCPIYGNEAAAVFGDDIDFRSEAVQTDLVGFQAMMFMLRRAGSDGSAAHRVATGARLMASGGKALVEQMANHCSAAGVFADRLGLDGEVKAGIEQAYARWDGKGVPAELQGDGLSLAARVSHVAEACEVAHRLGGIDNALGMVRSRRGTHFDPAVADAALVDADALFDGIDVDAVDDFLTSEPFARPTLTDDQLDAALEAIGDFCDLRCPYFAGHARGTAALVDVAGTTLQLTADEARLVRRAAWVHDLGRFGVPGTVWDKPGPLSATDQERMRLHVYYVERIFQRPEPLRRVGLLAATHHERMDGSGYHRGVGGAMLSTPARLLAAADAYQAMLQPRPHRDARTPEDAASEMRAEADARRLDGDAVDAVLAAAGHATRPRATAGPSGLTAREADVLGLLAQGMSNKAIATTLGISAKTVGNHVEHVYTKLGVNNRAGAALRAMEFGVIGPAPTVA